MPRLAKVGRWILSGTRANVPAVFGLLRDRLPWLGRLRLRLRLVINSLLIAAGASAAGEGAAMPTAEGVGDGAVRETSMRVARPEVPEACCAFNAPRAARRGSPQPV